MDTSKLRSDAKLDRAARLRQIAAGAAQAAMTADRGHQDVVLDAAEELMKMAESVERKARQKVSEPSVAIFGPDATVEEIRKARRRQSIRQGSDTFLPAWKDMALALPTAFLRSALFSSSQNVQANSSKVLAGDLGFLVAGKKIAALSNITLTLSGYELCQFDRHVYATCLDYFRDRPLIPDDSQNHIATSFYKFINMMRQDYGVTTHRAVRASLLRLSLAQLRLRYNGWNLEVPKLLTVSFEDGATTGVFKAGDLMLLRVTECVANLFGPGGWTAVDKDAVAYDGLRGWLASFYAGHSAAAWLPVATLRELSGYHSHPRNFKKSLITALEKLKDEATPAGCRVSEFLFSVDGESVMVKRAAWNKTPS